uniref:integrin beta-4 n=1 Tax=Myxine glutinosa TaxID=7769 RepID=UPI00358F1D7F
MRVLNIGVLVILFFSATCSGSSCSQSNARTCYECLQFSPKCAYCSQEKYDHQRCDTFENLRRTCKEITNVKSSATVLEKTEERMMMESKTFKVSPSRMKVQLRPGDSYEFDYKTFEYLKAPVDLYFLMDNSNSMENDLENLKAFGQKIANAMMDISDEFQIGFGKFVDKVVAPQTDMRPGKLLKPWKNSDPPFSFKNVIPLTAEIKDFIEQLKDQGISGNRDAPEGGFDAMLQVAVCKNKIGWRNETTHLLVFCTESAFHYEADGTNVLAGILERNDEKCHLSGDGTYTMAEYQDYPSIPMLVRHFARNSIIPIFAITNHAIEYYKRLSHFFPDSTIGELDDDSSNIMEILKSSFKALQSNMHLQAENIPRSIRADFFSDNPNENMRSLGTDFKAKAGEINTFRVKLTAQKEMDGKPICEQYKSEKKGSFTVKPARFYHGLEIDYEILCACPCEASPGSGSTCNNNGDMFCGHCYCHEGWIGTDCTCRVDETHDDLSETCKAPGSDLLCSGHGNCVCGECICTSRPGVNKPYSGLFCECDDFLCPRSNDGRICNDNGDCNCGACNCRQGWIGIACECTQSTETCRDSKGGLCNDKGDCICGKCRCKMPELFSGHTCEICQNCQEMCENTRACVQCKMFDTGEKKGTDCESCLDYIDGVYDLKSGDQILEHCKFKDEEDGCIYQYTVDYDPTKSNQNHIEALKEKDCPGGSFLWLLPLIMFLIPLLGLLFFLCWKCCTSPSVCCKGYQKVPPIWKGRTVGFKKDNYSFEQKNLVADYLDTPLERAGPVDGTDVVQWSVTDNVQWQHQHQPKNEEIVHHGITIRLLELMSDGLTKPGTYEHKALVKDVEENLNSVYRSIVGTHSVQNTVLRTQPNSGKREKHIVVDTILPSTRSNFQKILDKTDLSVSSGSFNKLPVAPDFYTVASDRDAHGLMEYQDDVKSQDVRVPLFIKEEDDNEKKLLVKALSVPKGLAHITKPEVNITIIKDLANSVVGIVKPEYVFKKRKEEVMVPVQRKINEPRPATVQYRTHDLSAIANEDYLPAEGVLHFDIDNIESKIPLSILAPKGISTHATDPQQFEVELHDPTHGARIGRYKRSIITLLEEYDPGVLEFSKGSQNFEQNSPEIRVPVTRTRGQDGDTTVRWKTIPTQSTQPSAYNNMTDVLQLPEGKVSNVILIPMQQPIDPDSDDSFQVVLYEPTGGVQLGQRKETVVTVLRQSTQQEETDILQKTTNLGHPQNMTAKALNGHSMHLKWQPSMDAERYKVCYWIEGEEEKDAQVIETKNSEMQLNGLYPYCEYLVRVISVSGSHRAASEIINCRTEEEVPSEPGRLAFTIVSSTTLQLSWGEPPETNGVIKGYEITYTLINENGDVIGPTKRVQVKGNKKRVLLIENLREMAPYHYTVRATNTAGWGPDRVSTMNIAKQTSRPLSIPIIPDIPIVDAQNQEDYKNYYMYSDSRVRNHSFSSNEMDGYASPKKRVTGNLLDSSSMTRRGDTKITTNVSRTMTQTMAQLGSTDYLYSGMAEKVHIQKADVMLINTLNTSPSGKENDAIMNPAVNFKWQPPTLNSHGSDLLCYDDISGLQHDAQGSRYGCEEVSEALRYLDQTLQSAGSTTQPTSPIRSPVPWGIPEAPGRLVFSATGPTSLKVNWQKPFCDANIFGYRVTYHAISEGISKNIEITDPDQTTVNVDHLLPNEAYTFQVMAKSELGWGPDREGVITIESQVNPTTPHIPIPGSPFTLSTPNAPGPLVFAALTHSSLQLRWEQPLKPQGTVVGYTLTCEPVSLESGEKIQPRIFNIEGEDNTQLIVDDLMENVPYKFKVKSRTTQGFGPEREGIITIEAQDQNPMEMSDVSEWRSEAYTASPWSQQVVSRGNTGSADMFNFPVAYSSSTGMTQMMGAVTKQVTMTKTTRVNKSTTKQTNGKFYAE